MDHRPHRPSRSMSIMQVTNENMIHTHARQKSAGNAKQAANGGAFRVAAKRTAFGDLSNISKPTDGVTSKEKVPMNTVAKISENDPTGKEGFSRPAQRVGAVKPLATKQSKSALAAQPLVAASRTSTIIKNNASKKTTVVYKDAEPAVEGQHVCVQNVQPVQHDDVSAEDDTEAEGDYEDAVETLLAEVETGAAAAASLTPDANVHDIAATVSMNATEPHVHPAGIVEDGNETAYTDCYSDLDEETLAEESHTKHPDFHGDSDYTSYTLTGRVYGSVVSPVVTDSIRLEIMQARQYVTDTETLEEIEEELADIGMVREYSEDIYQYMRELEESLKPDLHYMDKQTELRWSMRSVLIDWVVQVHARFHLYPETLHLTVNLIDRFLSKKVVSLGKLQLVGATALLIASKYEEVNVPSVREIVYMVDEGYQAEEILKAEKYMSNLLDWQLGYPSALNFLRRASKADEYDEKIRTVAKYLVEAAMMDERFVACVSSHLAAGSQCLARLLLNAGSWTPSHVHYSGYTYEQLVPFMLNLITCLWQAKKHHPAVFDKYSQSRYQPAILVQDAIAAGFNLPAPAYPVNY